MDRNKVLFLVGPTACGKTETAVKLAEILCGEIVSSDSMQIYRLMDIGSAKPTFDEMKNIPHHLIGEIDPKEYFTVKDYEVLAKGYIRDILKRGNTPIVTGGTGLYVNSLIYDMDFTQTSFDLDFRKEMEEYERTKGREELHKLLYLKDREAALRIHKNNVKKVIRALEILRSEERVKTFEESFKPVKEYRPVICGIYRERKELYERIDRRAEELLKKGLVEEVRMLSEKGLTKKDIALLGIGYKEIYDYLKGETSLKEAEDLIKQHTRNLAKRQMTWFKRYEDVFWVNMTLSCDPVGDIVSWWKKQ
ncbi:MAG: tRNA (adenosine(37)-N6)-dimethylallyltransferase MiaA [Anaerovoracaceae bacterium]|nr:tRNA (adenosine(37)-N6)-dimethylallyltransferase MiaA [Clostridiales bacterium]